MEIKIYQEEHCIRLDVNLDGLDHQICIGIRHGLYGLNAGNNENIINAIERLAETIESLKK